MGGADGYFFVIGAMKAGTTSLYHYLAEHPEIYASPKKEPRVFSHIASAKRRAEEFEKLFVGRQGEKWAFEASTAYSKYPRVAGVPERVHEAVPEARFIYLVRDPVDRMWSQYSHNLAHGREERCFQAAIGADSQYLDNSRYWQQLKRYLDVFPRERMLVLVFEEMLADPCASLERVYGFLDVQPGFRPGNLSAVFNDSASKRVASLALRAVRRLPGGKLLPWRIRHWAKSQSKKHLPNKGGTLTEEVRVRLSEKLRDDMENLFDFLGREVECWESVRHMRGQVGRGATEPEGARTG